MIASFRSKSLRNFWNKSDARGLNPQHVQKIDLILGMLDESSRPEDMNLDKLRLHKLTGEKPPRWSVWVNGNWRITFAFDGEDAVEVD